MRKTLVAAALIFALFSSALAQDAKDPLARPLSGTEMNSTEFLGKLVEMHKRTDESIRLMREQIIQSQSAPFLAELFMELADLLSQKSNVLYYIQMEKTKSAEITDSEKAFSPVIQAQKEAIQIYKRVLSDFPSSKVVPKARFRLSVSLKAIDEIPEFLKNSKELIAKHPGTEEAMRTQILLGEYHYLQADLDVARDYLTPVTRTSSVYERNLALYRIGLIDLGQDRFLDALSNFEKVIREQNLTEQDNPYEISLKSRQVKSDIRREALIDSIRAYTRAFEKNPDPVTYYAKLAPTEALFQEVIEKLALRYIYLKKYEQAVKLLRTMSERIADTQKVMEIYHDVLMMIPPKDRISILVPEMEFVLDRFSQWSSYFALSPASAKSSFEFYEKNIRDLATTSHDLAKIEKDPAKKSMLLKRAQEFYRIYIGFFNKGPTLVKMATNLADVYFSEKNYLLSGDYYLRTFQGEFGPSAKDSRTLIENAIFCLQKTDDKEFFENIRRRGLLIKATKQYMEKFKDKRSDPKLTFTSLKAQYEQGFFPEVLGRIFAFVRANRASPEAIKGADLILDYYSVRNDFTGIDRAASQLLSLKLGQSDYNAKLVALRKQAKSRVLQEKVRSIAGGYDDFAQGKSYLAAALKSGDAELANEVLTQALARSKAERDIETFLATGKAMVGKEPNPAKRASILRSIAHEQIRIGRFYAALATLAAITQDSSLSKKDQIGALDEAVNNVLTLRDWTKLSQLMSSPLARALPAETHSRVAEQIVDLIRSRITPSGALLGLLFTRPLGTDSLNVLYRNQSILNSGQRARVLAQVGAACKSSDSKTSVCAWEKMAGGDSRIDGFKNEVASAPPTIPNLEIVAKKFQLVSESFLQLEGTGDLPLEGALAIRQYRLYSEFGTFLSRVADKNPDVRAVLDQKMRETQASANTYFERCERIPQTRKHCPGGRFPSSADLLSANGSVSAPRAPGDDPRSDEIDVLQKSAFSAKEEARSTFDLARHYFREKHFSHAAALSSYGAAHYPDLAPSFKAILGCSLIPMELLGEARYHLKEAEDVDGLKARCQNQLMKLSGKVSQ